MNRLLTYCLLFLLLGSWGACSTENPMYTQEMLAGKWLRVRSTDVRSDSMIIEVRRDSAVIIAVPDSSNFRVGQVKWLGITPVTNQGDFICADLSADSNRWQASILITGEDSLPNFCELVSRNYPKAPGAFQEWVRIP